MARKTTIARTAGRRTAVLLLLAARMAWGQTAYFVAPDGDDGNPGTRERPFATLDRARDAIRTSRPAGGATVCLRGGRYLVRNTFILSKEDSGTAAAPVVYAAVPGESATLFGGTVLEKAWFVPVTDPEILARVVSPEARPKLRQCDLRAQGIVDYGELSRRGFHKANLGKTPPVELYIGGERMHRARWPNPDEHFPEVLRGEQKRRLGVVGRSRIVDPGPGMNDADFLDRGGTIGYDFDRPALWIRAEDIWLDGIFTWSWEWSYNKVAKIDPERKEITLRYGEVGTIADRYSFDYFFAENLLEEIDQPGEYYLDRPHGMLYLLPPDSFAREDAEVVLATLAAPMVSLTDASHVVFRDLAFDTGRGSGILCQGGRNVVVEHCEIRNLSGAGVSLAGQEHGVRGCRIHHVGAAGVSLQGGDLKSLEPGGCFVEDSEITHFAWYRQVYSPAVSLGYRSVGNRVAHNRIWHGPHLALVVYGNDHRIEYNDIGHVVEDFTDMGIIYGNLGARPLERGTVIRRNYFHHVGQEHHLQNGVYPDNMTMGWRIEENVFHRIGAPGPAANCRAINLNSAAHVVSRHNVFVDCTIPCMMSSHSGKAHFAKHSEIWKTYFQEHDLATLPHAAKYPELLRFFDEPRQFPDTCVFERNVIYNPNTPLLRLFGRERRPMHEGALDETGALQVRDNWVTDADPGFRDAGAGDFALRPDAPLFARIPGFPAIPFAEIGPRGPVGPRQARP